MQIKINPPSDLFGGDPFVVDCGTIEITLDDGTEFRIGDDGDCLRVWANDTISMTAGCSNMIEIRNKEK